MKAIIFTAAAALALVACSDVEATQSADAQRRAQTEQMMREATRQVPPPAIANWQELRWQTFLYELRDQEIATYSYYQNWQGELFLICESVGYGMPASVQITNPERIWMEGQDTTGFSGSHRDVGGTIPQPEPNGLFMPEGLQATYVLCSDGEGGIRPVYWEPELIVSPFPLRHISDVREIE
ncbi:hypothetical protein [Oceanicaulis sp.]|uniref:hypothetical protein n=1 Tax=Oceanicaulis sp. TaxID=1924941 RepID=UPI003D2CA651